MDVTEILNGTKWEILSTISQERASPLEIAKSYNTTIANISQQLRLLEAFGLVKKEKIPNRDKGKPRTLFSLKQDLAYIIPITKNFTKRKLLELTKHQKIILKIWFMENPEIRYIVEKAFWKIEPHLKSISSIFISLAGKNPEIIIVTEKSIPQLKNSPELRIEDQNSQMKKILIKTFDNKSFKKTNNLVEIYNQTVPVVDIKDRES